MSFQKFCRNIYIEVEDDMTTLYADVKDSQDKYNRSALVLDEYLGTSEGELNWGGKDFTESAENIELNFREDGLWLEADLVVGEGEGEDEEKQKERRGINLSERLMIKDGDLVAGV